MCTWSKTFMYFPSTSLCTIINLTFMLSQKFYKHEIVWWSQLIRTSPPWEWFRGCVSPPDVVYAGSHPSQLACNIPPSTPVELPVLFPPTNQLPRVLYTHTRHSCTCYGAAYFDSSRLVASSELYIFSNLPHVQSVLGTQWYILQCRGFESHLGMLFFFPELSWVYVHVVVDFACFALALLTHNVAGP